MKKIIKHISSFLVIGSFSFANAQTPLPPVMVDGSQPWTSGSINIKNTDRITYYNSSTQAANVQLNPSKEVRLQAGAVASNFISQGEFHAYTTPSSIDVVSFHPNGWENIPKYEKFELGVKLPSYIQSMVDNFLNGLSGINPYDPAQLQVECTFNNGAYIRYGFYYRNFITQNNSWIEQPTDYKFRIRIAPEQVGSNKAVIKIYVQGVLIETLERYFQVINNSDPGHLSVSNNGSLLKLQHSNGKMFFGVGQNIPYAEGLNNAPCRDMIYGSCACPDSYETQRNYLNDLANNGGNFTRVRLQADNSVVEWSYQPILTTDPNVDPNIPMSKYLNNYDVNQRYMWEMDKTFKTMEDRGIYAILSLIDDNNYSKLSAYTSNTKYLWESSPYTSILGTDINACKNFFSDATAKSYYKKQLYYIMARWGYSKSMAIWQLINETANLANNIAGGNSHMLENDATFNMNVKNWICEMKTYLQQYYPLRPVNTGFVSDDASANMTYDCLNIWSSNMYGTYIDANYKYSDIDFNNRSAPGISSYFPSNKPFFWGEVGLADGINLIDDNSDIAFHNCIWATTFTGGISNALYWNDWQQKKGINHRYNFRALRAFTDKIDFTQRLEPAKEVDEVNGREIKTWSMKNSAKNYIVGWTKNNSYNWTRDLANFSNADQQVIVNKINYSVYNVEPLYITSSATQEPQTVIKGLLPSTNYKIKIYNTYDYANEIEVKTEYSDPNGTLKFKRTMYPYINDPFNPDYAFIIKPNSSWRMSNNEINITDTIYASTEDTIVLSSSFITKKNNYKYNWNKNMSFNQDSLITVTYPTEGIYNILLQAKNLRNDTIINHNFILSVSNKTTQKALNNISVYPIPTNDFINVLYDSEIIKNPSITCTDILGNKINLSQNELYKFDVSNLRNGVYFIKVEYAHNQKIFKINIIH